MSNKQYREKIGEWYFNELYDIDCLPFNEEEKKTILEYLAQKYWQIILAFDDDSYCKHYDPLVISGGQAHSYIFDLEDGGRHHSFKNLKHLEKMLTDETIETIKNNCK